MTMMVIMGLLFTSSIDALNSAYPFNGIAPVGEGGGRGDDNVDVDDGSGSQEFVLSINISENTLHATDKDMSSYHASLGVPSRALASDGRHPPLAVSEEHKLEQHVHHEINKSNQGDTNSPDWPASPSALGPGEFVESSKMPIRSASSTHFERVELPESQTSIRKDKLSSLPHHRHKRYLVFPEGSSLQLVFDLIVPIVDYTNYAIMGITCAVAWELPTKPPSEIIENFRQKLNDGTFGLIRRNDSVHEQQQQQPPLHYITTGQGNAESVAYAGTDGNQETLSAPAATTTTTFADYMTTPRNIYYSNMRHLNYEYHRHQPKDDVSFFKELDKSQRRTAHGWTMQPNSAKWYLQNSPQRSNPSSKWWPSSNDAIEEQRPPNERIWKSYDNTKRPLPSRKILKKYPIHRIVPIFGKRKKRSYDVLAKQLQVIHTREHLKTRHKLYGKIEKLYKTRGHNGTVCVLQALCEIHKDHHAAPRPFVMELLRAIFTLPQDPSFTVKGSLPLDFIASPYMEAVKHALRMPSCSRHYDGCEHPIWNDMEF
uniref:Uncharacterized protein n=1 Tax=Stomoxys calcitrans TaxID=35570 RepID=A0A1I8P4K0_STOCA